MQIIILAAGRGTRLQKLTLTEPKTLLPLNGKPTLFHLIQFCSWLKPSDVWIVTGYKAKRINRFIDLVKNQFAFNINQVYCSHRVSGNIFSLAKALKKVQKSFLILNGDHLYTQVVAKQVEKLGHNRSQGIFVVCDQDRHLTEDDMKVLTHRHRLQAIDKNLTSYNGGYTGITYCSNQYLHLYKQVFAQTLQQAHSNTAVETVLQKLIDTHSYFPKVGYISGKEWLEIDTPNDLVKARQRWKDL